MRRIALPLVIALALAASGGVREVRGSDTVIRDAVARGVVYLVGQQEPGGAFPTLRCRGIPAKCVDDCSIFATALALDALTQLAGTAQQSAWHEIQRRGIAYLARYREADNSLWRFWPYNCRAPAPLPPDLDTTAIASSVLLRQGKGIVPDNLSAIAALRRADGLYPTWVTTTSPVSLDEPADCVVQANLLHYLGLRHVDAPQACARLDRDVVEGRFPGCSVYYRDDPLFQHLVLRAYRDGGVACLAPAVAAIAARLHVDAAVEPQDIALGIITATRIGTCRDVPAALTRLAAVQRDDGSWARGTISIIPKTDWYFTSEALTAAFAVQALLAGGDACGS